MFDILDADRDGLLGVGDLRRVAGDRLFEVFSETDAEDENDFKIDFSTFSSLICGSEEVETV